MVEIVDFHTKFLSLRVGSAVCSKIIFYWWDDEIFLGIWNDWVWHYFDFFYL